MSEYDLIAALVVTVVALAVTWYYAYKQSQSAKESLSLNTFARSLDEFASKEARDARIRVHQNFPDYTQEDYSFKEWRNNLKKEEKTKLQKLWIREGMDEPKQVDRIVKILQKESWDKKDFGEMAVRADRVGFMFFTLEDISSKFRGEYLDWLCFTFCGLWNKIAPHVEQER